MSFKRPSKVPFNPLQCGGKNPHHFIKCWKRVEDEVVTKKRRDNEDGLKSSDVGQTYLINNESNQVADT